MGVKLVRLKIKVGRFGLKVNYHKKLNQKLITNTRTSLGKNNKEKTKFWIL